MKLGILFTGGGHEMKKLSEILGLENLSTVIERTEADFAIDGVEAAIKQVDQFEIDYERIASQFADHYGIYWSDVTNPLQNEMIKALKRDLPPEKLFKKKVG